jgi:SpoVK/Ycf46/Vps4 family AAA+-type ATPase
VCRRFPAVHSQVVAGPELYSKYLGETEAQLRQVFGTAVRSAPAILVLEDLDCLAPRREGAGGSDLERRLAVTLQTLLDRLGRDQSRNKERLFTQILTGIIYRYSSIRYPIPLACLITCCIPVQIFFLAHQVLLV